MTTAARTRVRRSVAGAKASVKSLDATMNELAELHMARAKLDDQIEDKEKSLASMMGARGIDEYSIDIAKVTFKPPIGRSTNIIDPRKFRDLCQSDTDFYDAVTVSVTNAKKVVAERELKAITKTTPPVEKPPVIKFKLK